MPIVLLSDTVIILISVMITFMIYHDTKFLLSAILILCWDKLMTLTEAETIINTHPLMYVCSSLGLRRHQLSFSRLLFPFVPMIVRIVIATQKWIL